MAISQSRSTTTPLAFWAWLPAAEIARELLILLGKREQLVARRAEGFHLGHVTQPGRQFAIVRNALARWPGTDVVQYVALRQHGAASWPAGRQMRIHSMPKRRPARYLARPSIYPELRALRTTLKRRAGASPQGGLRRLTSPEHQRAPRPVGCWAASSCSTTSAGCASIESATLVNDVSDERAAGNRS